MYCASSRPAKIAASFAMFARSAPVKPAVWRAIIGRSTSDASGLSRVCTPRIASREPRSGGRPGDPRGVEAPGTQQRRVELVEPVRSAHDDDLILAAEAVELDEQLVERLVLLAVETVSAARRADGGELVDED